MRILLGLITGTLSGTTPILLAALGGAFSYYAGVFNIALEGMMLMGAFGAVLGSYFAGSWIVGVLAAVAGALLMSLIFIIFAIWLKTDEFITGIALNLFAVGATTYLLRQIFEVKGVFTSPQIQGIPAINIPFVRNIPFIGEIISDQNLMVYVAVLVTGIVAYVIFRTKFGLRLRAAGYNAASLNASGVSATRVRIVSLLICGGLCGLAGAFLSLGYVRLFAENMTAGRGWISFAAIVLVSGNPIGIALIAVLFGFADSLGLFFQGFGLPPQFTGMVPYVATLIALFVYARRKRHRAV